MAEWIKCNERMPEDEVPVLTYRNGRYGAAYSIETRQKIVGRWYWVAADGYSTSDSPDYWQSLPEPPNA
jgi:hypothetical protein